VKAKPTSIVVPRKPDDGRIITFYRITISAKDPKGLGRSAAYRLRGLSKVAGRCFGATFKHAIEATPPVTTTVPASARNAAASEPPAAGSASASPTTAGNGNGEGRRKGSTCKELR
jgi:hypothetical protein